MAYPLSRSMPSVLLEEPDAVDRAVIENAPFARCHFNERTVCCTEFGDWLLYRQKMAGHLSLLVSVSVVASFFAFLFLGAMVVVGGTPALLLGIVVIVLVETIFAVIPIVRYARETDVYLLLDRAKQEIRIFRRDYRWRLFIKQKMSFKNPVGLIRRPVGRFYSATGVFPLPLFTLQVPHADLFVGTGDGKVVPIPIHLYPQEAELAPFISKFFDLPTVDVPMGEDVTPYAVTHA